jgi:glycolate oxidase
MGIEVVLADGEVVWLGGEAREVPGYDLRGAFIGSEGTLGVVTQVAVRLQRLPEAVQTMVATFRSLDQATQTVSDIIAGGVLPAAIEMIDKVTIAAVEPYYHPGYPPDAEAVLLVEVDGLRETVKEESAHIEVICRKNGTSDFRSSDDPVRRAELWATRKGAIGAFGNLRPNYYLVDGVVPRTKLRDVMRKISNLGAELDILIANVFHAGDGNLHPCILFDEREPGAVEKTIGAGEKILELCVEAGGALSGEHGIGIEKQAYMGLMYNPDDLAAMAKLKPAFGAGESFNPSKIFPTGRDLHGAAYRGAIRRTGTAEVV